VSLTYACLLVEVFLCLRVYLSACVCLSVSLCLSVSPRIPGSLSSIQNTHSVSLACAHTNTHCHTQRAQQGASTMCMRAFGVTGLAAAEHGIPFCSMLEGKLQGGRSRLCVCARVRLSPSPPSLSLSLPLSLSLLSLSLLLPKRTHSLAHSLCVNPKQTQTQDGVRHIGGATATARTQYHRARRSPQRPAPRTLT
jgi:hypothetical protein